jgi:hypothetical protein
LLAEHDPLACLDSFTEVYEWLRRMGGVSSVTAVNS